MNERMRILGIAFLGILLAGASAFAQQEAPVDLSNFPSKFFPGLSEQPPKKVYLEGLVRLYPGRVLDEAPELTASDSTREPLVENLPRGITYIRIYDLENARTSLNEHILDPILLLDLRYCAFNYSSSNLLLSQLSGGTLALPLQQNEQENVDPEFANRSVGLEFELRTVKQPPIILVNELTRGSIEAALEALQNEGKIMTVGTRTAGKTGSYKPVPEVEGFWVIDGEIMAVGGTSLLGVGLEPDVPVTVTPEEDFTGYQLLESGYSAESILSIELPKLNPQKTVQTDEETSAETKDVDPILQRAVEIVIALQVLNKISD